MLDRVYSNVRLGHFTIIRLLIYKINKFISHWAGAGRATASTQASTENGGDSVETTSGLSIRLHVSWVRADREHQLHRHADSGIVCRKRKNV